MTSFGPLNPDFASSRSALLFDLDGTITDYRASSAEGLKRAYRALEGNVPEIMFGEFASAYAAIIENEHPEASKHGLTASAFDTRVKRFAATLDRLRTSFTQPLLQTMAREYGIGRAEGASLFPGVRETLTILKQHFRIGLITEGSVETQQKQIDRLDLGPFFDSITISGATPYHKPAPDLYRIASRNLEADPQGIIMIGDRIDWDLQPAHALGMKTILFFEDNQAIGMIEYSHCVDAVITRFGDLTAIIPEKN